MAHRTRPSLPLACIILLLAFGALAAAPPAGLASHLPHFVPEVVEGFAIAPLAAAGPGITALAFGPGDGAPDLYATVATGQVLRYHLAWTAAGPLVAGISVAATNFSLPLGVVFGPDEAMYVADSHSNPDTSRTEGRVTRVHQGASAVVVDGLPNGRHNTNHLRFGPDGLLYIANGNPNDSGGNAGGDLDVFPYSGAILRVDAAQVAASPAVLQWMDGGGLIPVDQIPTHPANADFHAKVGVLAWGFRNVYGVAFSAQGIAYTGMNGADVPSSQDALFRITPGANYSFPFCYNVGPPGGVGASVQVAPNPSYGDASLCTSTQPATALLGWHTCATGLDFPTAGPWAFPAAMVDSVFVGECGPFFADDLAAQAAQDLGNATHNTGHKVRRVPLDASGHALEVRDFVTGLALPTDVLFGPDGAMYVADAQSVYRVIPTP